MPSSSTFRRIALLLWALVLVGAAYLVWTRKPPRGPAEVYAPDAAGIKQVAWKHLPTIEPFELTDSSGAAFDSAELHGRPYVVCFFYSTCPTICRQLNEQIQRLTQQFRAADLTFLSISVDPGTDTPERLRQYAEIFGPDPQHWHFLTGPFRAIQALGQEQFRVIIDKAVHTEDILLVDRWGRFRDRFKWDDPAEMKRFAQVAQAVLRETEPPLAETIATRNLLAGNPHVLGNMPPWLHEFFLTRADGVPFYSRDLIGQVWIGSVFYSSCTTHCIEQNRYLRDLQERLAKDPVVFVSITTDPQIDTPARLRRYAQELKADPQRWIFLTGEDDLYLRRVAGEFLGLYAEGGDHASALVVVDRWGKVRGRFNWREAAQEAEMLQLIAQLRAEAAPPKPSQAKPEAAHPQDDDPQDDDPEDDDAD